MCIKNYLVSVKEAVKGELDHVSVKVAAVTMGLMAAYPTLAFASESSGGSSGVNMLTGDVWDAIQSAFGNLAVTATGVVAIAVVTGCTVIGMSAGAKYAMKKIKGTLNQAA